MSNNRVTCGCGAVVHIPQSKEAYRLATTLAFFKTIDWQFYGRGKGCCPDCNLFSSVNEIGKEMVNK